MPVAVHRQAEGHHALALRLQQGHVGVVDGVFLLGAVAPVAVVLGAPVGHQEEDAHFGLHLLQLVGGVADGRPHAGGAHRRYLVYAPLHPLAEGLLQLLDDVELHVLPPVAREAVDAVGVADGLQGADEQDNTLLLHINDALGRRQQLLGAARHPPGEVFAGVVVEIVGPQAAAVLDDLLVGGGAHVQQEGHGHVPLHLVAPPVDLPRRRHARLPLHQVVHHRVQVQLFAVQQPLDLAEQLRLQQLELAARLVDQGRVAAEGLVEVGGGAFGHGVFDDAAPAGLVVAGAEVPLVVIEVSGLRRQGLFRGVGGAQTGGAPPLPLLLGLLLLLGQLPLQVGQEEVGGLLQVLFAPVLQVYLYALLQQGLDLLGGEGRRLLLLLALTLLAQAAQQLDQLRLELAPEIHRLGAVVGLLLAL